MIGGVKLRRLAGYYQGRQISDHFHFILMVPQYKKSVGVLMNDLRQANDPRLAEIVKRLGIHLNQGGVPRLMTLKFTFGHLRQSLLIAMMIYRAGATSDVLLKLAIGHHVGMIDCLKQS